MKTLFNVDHVIRIVFIPMHIDTRLKWEPAHTEVESKLFGLYKKTTQVPGMYMYSNWTVINSLSEFDTNLYAIKKTGNIDEGPEGTLFYKPCVFIESTGGKYTTTKNLYFDTDADAEAYIDEIESQYPDKFIIIKK